MKNKKTLAIILALTLCVAISSLKVAAEAGFYPAEVKDISDRAYEKTVIGLLDNAEKSITISMFMLKPDENDRHPINRLMKDLEEALERGVTVQIYLNTKGWEGDSLSSEVGEGKAFAALREKGAEIYPVTSRHLLHDKMIIVDSRLVVIGSANWTVSALTDNFESTVLIDCPELAKDRLERMKTIHLEGEDLRGPAQISIKEMRSLPDMIELPRELMDDEKYFPKMIKDHANRAMDLYLLLIAESYRRDLKEFAISLEKMAGELGLPKNWKADALRRQVIKSLRKLKNAYGLIGVQFKYARAAKVKLSEITGETFPVKSSFFEPSSLTAKRQNKKFILLIEAYLKGEGKDIADFNYSELGRMFDVDRTTISEGLKK